MSKLAAVEIHPAIDEEFRCDYTDEELDVLCDEAEAEGGESVDGETFLQSLLARLEDRGTPEGEAFLDAILLPPMTSR